MKSPVKKEYITQGFGENPASYSKYGLKGHNGLDFRAFLPNGDRCYSGGQSEVFSPHDGTIKENALDANGYGNYVKIENDNEGSVLGHFSSLSELKAGTQVKEGQFIGYQGTTGNSTGIHLHWGFYKKPRNRQNGYDGFIDQKGLYQPFSTLPMQEKTYTEAEMSAMRLERDSNWNKYQSEKADHEATKSQLEEVKKELKQFIETLASKLTTIADKSEVIGAVERILTVEDQLNKANKAYSELETQKNALEADKNKEISRLQAEIEEIKKQSEEQRKQIEALLSDNFRLSDDVKRLGERVEELLTIPQQKADFEPFYSVVINFIRNLWQKK